LKVIAEDGLFHLSGSCQSGMHNFLSSKGNIPNLEASISYLFCQIQFPTALVRMRLDQVCIPISLHDFLCRDWHTQAPRISLCKVSFLFAQRLHRTSLGFVENSHIRCSA